MVLRFPRRVGITAVLIVLIVALPVYAYHQLEPIYELVHYETYLALSFLATVILTWFIGVIVEPPRAEHVLTWLMVPMLTVTALQAVWFPEWEISAYPHIAHGFVMIGAGLIGITVDHFASKVSKQHADALKPVLEHKVVLIAIIVLVIPLGLTGLSYAITPDSQVNHIDPVFSCGDVDSYENPIGDDDCPPGLQHTFAIEIDADAFPHKVIVESPQGEQRVDWMTRSQMSDGTVTVFMPITHAYPFDLGEYTVRLETIWGQTVDEATIDIDTQPDIQIEEVTVHEDSNGTTFDLKASYSGDFAHEPRMRITIRGDLQDDDIAFNRSFSFNGTGTDTISGTVIDEDGQARDLEPGSYEAELRFRDIDVTRSFVIEIPSDS